MKTKWEPCDDEWVYRCEVCWMVWGRSFLIGSSCTQSPCPSYDCLWSAAWQSQRRFSLLKTRMATLCGKLWRTMTFLCSIRFVQDLDFGSLSIMPSFFFLVYSRITFKIGLCQHHVLRRYCRFLKSCYCVTLMPILYCAINCRLWERLWFIYLTWIMRTQSSR